MHSCTGYWASSVIGAPLRVLAFLDRAPGQDIRVRNVGTLRDSTTLKGGLPRESFIVISVFLNEVGTTLARY